MVRKRSLEVLAHKLLECPPVKNIDNLHTHFPVDVRNIAHRLGIKKRVRRERHLRSSGLISFLASSRQIRVTTSDSEQRIRFTVAHEIAHYLIEQIRQGRIKNDGIDLSNITPRQEEILCNLFAAGLLMPQTEFKKQFIRVCSNQKGEGGLLDPGDFEFNHDKLNEICKYFGVSAEACIRTIHDLGLLNRTHFIAFVGARKPNLYTGQDKKFRIQIVAYPRGQVLIPRNMGLDTLGVRDSIISHAGQFYISEEVEEIFNISIKNKKGKYAKERANCRGRYRIQGQKNAVIIGVFEIEEVIRK